MEEREIVVTIDGKGKGLIVDLNNFHGVGCKAIAAAFDSIGPTIREEEKPEIYENHNQNTVRQRL